MQTNNLTLQNKLIELFDQHPYITSFSYNEQGILIPTDNDTLAIDYNQIVSITTHPDTVDIVLGNGTIYTASLSSNSVVANLTSINL